MFECHEMANKMMTQVDSDIFISKHAYGSVKLDMFSFFPVKAVLIVIILAIILSGNVNIRSMRALVERNTCTQICS